MKLEPEPRLPAAGLGGYLEAVLDGLTEGVTVQAQTGELIYANDAAAQLAGFASASELLGTPVEEVIARFELFDEHGRALDANDLPGRAALRGEEESERIVRFRGRGGGQERWSAVRAIPVSGADGSVLYAVNVFRDVTARLEVERQREALLDREQTARAEAEQNAEKLRRLEEVTQAGLAHLGKDDLLDEMLSQVLRVVDADTAAILLLDEERRHLTVRAATGFDRELEHAMPVPYGQGMAGRVASSGKPVVIDDLAEVELASPHLRERGIASLVAIPILAGGRVVGVAHAGSLKRGRFGEDDLRLLALMADRIALAVTQSHLYEAEHRARRAAEEAQGRLSFLAEASALLSSSLDYESTLQSVARMVVPHLADWCAVDVTDAEGRLSRIAVAHARLEHDELLRGAAQARPGEPDDPVGPYAVLRSGSSELASHVSDDLLEALGGDEDGVEALREVGFASYLCVPLHGRDRVLGTIIFASSRAGRYDEGDLALAEELARRAAVAVENALLYRQVEERAQAARVLEAVGDGVFLVDRWGVVRLWNAAAEAITGLQAALVVSRRADEAIPGWSELSARVPVSTEVGRGAARAEMVPLEIDGRELWLSLSGVGFADGTVYAFRDLTQDRALDELKAEFVSTVSHELRTPLAAIYGAAMTLQRPELREAGEQHDRLLSVIHRESERLATIVDDILWASRLDSNTLQLSIQSCDAEELVKGVVEAADVHRPANIELRLATPEDLPQVSGDPDKIRQVLANLLDNAVKYSPDGGRIEVELSTNGSSVRFAVHDPGLGVPAAEHRRIFEKFYRLDPDLTRGVGGTGLGLYICRELVRRMGGRIWVDSPRPGVKGSTFAFELPAARGRVGRPAAASRTG
jgi:PAS domain S-box-containing protein